MPTIPSQAEELIEWCGGAPVVIKLLEGTQGIGVVLGETHDSAKSVIQAFRGAKVNILVQEFIKEAEGADIRCLVIGGKVVASMKRKGPEGDFRSNLHRGGSATTIKITPEERSTAVRAAKHHGAQCLRRRHAALEPRAGGHGGQFLAGLRGHREGHQHRRRRQDHRVHRKERAQAEDQDPGQGVEPESGPATGWWVSARVSHHSLNCAGFVPTCKGMMGEAERTDAEGSAPTCRPETRAQKIAKGVALAVFVSLAIAGIFAALGMMAADSAAVVLAILFWLSVIGAILDTIVMLYRANIPRDQRKPTCDTGGIAAQIMRLPWRVLLVALLIGGYYGLAALLGYRFVLGFATRAENRRILGEGHKIGLLSRAIHWTVLGIAERLAPVYDPLHRLMMRPVGEVPLIAWVLLFPIIAVFAIPLFPIIVVFAIPFWLFDLLCNRKQQRNLVKAAHAEGKLAWFAYSEPHQRERFLGEGGVLHGMGDALIVKNWRADMDGIWRRDSGTDLDAMIASRYKLSNMREDLPVVVLFHPDGRTRPVLLSRAYRQRFRDGGDLLGALEGAIRQQISEVCKPA